MTAAQLPNRDDLTSFIDVIFRHADTDTWIALRGYPDRGREEPACIVDGGRIGDPRLADWTFNRAKQAAQHDFPVVFCPPTATFTNQKKADGAHLANGVALSVECDAHPQEARRKLSDLLGEPTAVVASGAVWTDPATGELQDKLHLHWRLSEPTREEADHARLKRARRLACAFVGSDPTAISVVHPLRWPGSVHRKAVPKLARFVAKTENEIDLGEALELLEAACPTPAEPKKGCTFKSIFGAGGEDALAGDALDVAAALAAIPNANLEWADWNKIGMAAWKATNGRGFAAFDAWSQRSAKYDADVTAGRWEHYSTSPPDKIGAGTLYFLAAEAMPGWRRPTLIARDAQRARDDKPGAGKSAGAEQAQAEDDGFGPQAKAAGGGTGGGQQKPDQKDEPRLVNDRGVLISGVRDRLEIALRPDAAPAFPVDALPTLMADMVAAMTDLVQAPDTLCAHAVLSAAVLVTQGLADIHLPNTLRAMPLSLFLLVVAASGERKSSCDALALRAVARLESRLSESYTEDMRVYRADRSAWEGDVSKVKADKSIDAEERRKRIRNLREPEEPTAPFLRAEEPNYEGLLNLMVKGRPSLGVFTAEGGQFLGGHGMSDDAKTRTLTGLSKIYDTGSAQRVRAKEIVVVDGRRVSISLAAQAKVASTLLGDELAQDQGFLGRFLVCYPDSRIGTREVRLAPSDADPRVEAFTDRVERLLYLQDGIKAPLRLPALGLDAEAWEVFRAFSQAIEDNVGEGKQWHPVRATAQRMAENVGRIAGVLHLFANGGTDRPVDGETLAAACEIGAFYLKEALRLTGGVIVDAETQAAHDLAAWIESRPGDLIAPSIIQQFAPRPRMNASTLRERIRLLCAAGRLEAIGEEAVEGKRFKEVYRINRREVH